MPTDRRTRYPEALAAEMERLRAVHRCGPGELKSKMARLPHFVSDLLTFVAARKLPVFVELVDKRFFVAIHIVNHLLCGGMDTDQVDMESRIAIAEFLTDQPSDNVLLSYLAACRAETIDSVREMLALLWTWLDKSGEDAARNAQVLTLYARDRARNTYARAEDFLPLFDLAETGKKVWILPNLQCLTNIYARVNLSQPQGLEGICLVHDEQLQYAKVLSDSKTLMERLAVANDVPVVPFADYRLRGRAELLFATCREEPCLQAADLIAGCAMRYARDVARSSGRAEPALRDAFFALLDTADPFRGAGVNLVFSDRALAQMRIPTLRPPTLW